MSSLPIPYCTPEEYLEMERAAEFKHEYRSGEIFAMAGAKRAHNLISSNALVALANQLRDNDCEVYANDMRVQGSQSRDYSYPEVVVVCGQPQFRDGREDTLLNPLVIVEVLSPSTEAYDRGEKFLRYRQIESLKEYILISQNAHRLEHFERQPDNSWQMREVSSPEESLFLPSINVRLALRDIYNKVALESLVRLKLEGLR